MLLLQKKGNSALLCYIFVGTLAAMATPTWAQDVPTLEELHLETQIIMRYARTQVTCQMYNQHGHAAAINFTLLLPETAFVTAFSMISEGKEYHAVIRDADFADEEYSRIEALDEEAGLIAKRSRDANIFEVSMTARSLGKVTFKLTHEQELKRENGLYTLPIHLHPGEIPANISVTVNINETSPLKNLRVSELRDYSEEAVFKKNSIATITQPDENSARITWKPTKWWMRQRAPINGIMSVQYDVTEPNQVFVDEDRNFIQIFQGNQEDSLPKHIVFVLDISGSMHGNKLQKMKGAMSAILDDLSPKDEFSLIFFSTRALIWTGSPSCHVISNRARLPEMAVLSVTSVNITKAKKCVGSLRAFGGTDINESLDRAVEASRIGVGHNDRRRSERIQPMIVFLTDGKPNGVVRDPYRITQIFTEKNKDLKASLFAIGFGDDVDFKFLKKISLQNGGFAKRVYDAQDADKQLENFYRVISSPIYSDVTFVYDNQDQLILETPGNVPLFFNGTSVVQAGKVAPGGTISGTIATEQGDMYIPRPTLVTGMPAEFLKRLNVYITILNLLKHTDDESKERARDLALEHSFVTKYTSLIVSRPEEEPIIAYEAPTNPGKSLSFSIDEESEVPPDETETPFTGLGLEDVQWLAVTGNDSYAMPGTDQYLRNLKVGTKKEVVPYESCTAPDGKPGHCYHLQHCVLQEFLGDFDAFTGYFCKVQNRFVGVCCPDEYTRI